MTDKTLVTDLAQFIGSETLYTHFTGLHYTEGLAYLTKAAAAYWLIDAVASYQAEARVRGEPFQLWELTVSDERSAALTMRRDSGEEPLVRQEIQMTDFPLDSIKLYVANGVLMLPSEY